MSLRFITGGSGQGKTAFVIDEVIRRSGEEPGRQFYVIVPEQFSLEMQRSIASSHPDRGYMNIDVLSFYRLAYRVFDECGYQPDDILEDLGVNMILRRILSEHPEEFPAFKKNRNQAGFLDELKSVLMEFLCYGVSWDSLDEISLGLEDHPVLRIKCQELSRLYRYFEEMIEGRFMVTEQIYHVLCDFVPGSKLLSGAVFYFDGFTGFTPVQLHLLKELLPFAGQLNITVTIPARPEDCLMHSGEDLFSFCGKTIRSLAKICRASGQVMEEGVFLAQDPPPRFSKNPEMALIERGIFRSRKKPFTKETGRIHVVSCFNPEQEAEYILHKIEYLVRSRGYRYRDFAVLTGDMGEYASAFERQAGILNIPLFTDTKKRMSYHPSIETLRALFQLVEKNYSYESVFRYLKAGMSHIGDDDADRLENYCLSAGVRGHSMWSRPFTRKMGGMLPEEADRLNDLRETVLMETEDFYMAWKDTGSSVRRRMTALYEQMCRLDYAGRLSRMADEEERKGNYVREKEYREIFSLLTVLMDKIVDIFGEEAPPVHDLSELMDAGMESLGLGVLPLSMDQLVLGDLKRTRLPEIRVLFIAGLNEGIIPPALKDGGILTDDEKEILSEHGITLSNGLAEQSIEDEFYMYLAFSRPRDELYFTCSDVSRDGSVRHSSPVLAELYGIFPELKIKTYPGEEKRFYFNTGDSREYLLRTLAEGDYDKEDPPALTPAQRMLLGYWMAREDLHRDLARLFEQRKRQRSPRQLSADMAAALYGPELSGSVTRLERFAACPYQYFCIYGLGLYDREEYEVYPVDIGNLFHKALDYFSRQVRESEYSWKSLPGDYEKDLIGRSLRYAADDTIKDVLESTERNRYKLHSVQRILERTIKVIRHHLADSDLEPDRFELSFGRTDHLSCGVLELSDQARMYLQGVIDRIDIYEDDHSVLMRVIDYKSGAQVFDMDDLYHGLQLQLVLYMRTAREIYGREYHKTVIPAGMYYHHLKDPIIRADAFDESLVVRNFRMSGYTNSSPEILEKIEHEAGELVSASVKINKTGLPSKTSQVLSEEGFGMLEDYAMKKAGDMGRRIYQGEIDTHPFNKEMKTACDYCAYRPVCGFDPRERQHYRSWKKMSADKVLEEIRKQVD